MSSITKGLIVADPWIDRILHHGKTWEMRSSKTKHRGPLALIRSGTGTIVGITNIIDCLGPLTADEIVQAERYHHVPEGMVRDPGYKWCHAWVLEGARVLDTPVPYAHPKGAVIWVTLRAEERVKLDRALSLS